MERVDLTAYNTESFLETYIDVLHKIRDGIPMTTAKEEIMEDFLNTWKDLFKAN